MLVVSQSLSEEGRQAERREFCIRFVLQFAVEEQSPPGHLLQRRNVDPDREEFARPRVRLDAGQTAKVTQLTVT